MFLKVAHFKPADGGTYWTIFNIIVFFTTVSIVTILNNYVLVIHVRLYKIQYRLKHKKRCPSHSFWIVYIQFGAKNVKYLILEFQFQIWQTGVPYHKFML